MDVNRKAQLLAFYAPAGVRLSREEKRPKNIVPILLKFGGDIFGFHAQTAPEMADKIEALGKAERRKCCLAYRANMGPRPPNHPKTFAFHGRVFEDRLVTGPEPWRQIDHIDAAAYHTEQPQCDSAKIKEFYASWDWKRSRYEHLKGKERKCLCCGAARESGAKMVVDHIKPIRRFWHLRMHPDNLQILCDDCNMGKGSRDETDFAELNRRSQSSR